MKTVLERRIRRKLRLKKRLAASLSLPQVIVFRSNKHTYSQLYDPKLKRVIIGLTSKHIKQGDQQFTKTQLAFELGRRFGEILKQRGILKVVFNRNGFKYHGRVKAVCDGLREVGVKV